jgi:D-alanyl-D-alanine carboxypeptidase
MILFNLHVGFRGDIMSSTWEENYSEKIKDLIETHKRLERPIILWFNIVVFFAHNSKRLVCVVAVAIFFITGTSFNFAGDTDYEENLSGDKWAAIQENYEYIPTALNADGEQMPSDDDLLKGYDDKEEVDQFSLDDLLEVSDDIVDINESTEKPVSKLSKDDWQLILVNKQHPVPDGYEFTSGIIKGSMKCDVRIIADLRDMMKAAKAEGINLVVSSSYRDYNRQTYLFNRKIDYYTEKGYSYLEAYKLASITVTVPDASEHQIGLALDISSTTYSELEVGFGDTNAGKWLAAHCAEYGFIVRYPLGKEDITGIQYEPWHFRYVGKTAATEIMDRGITLEEFVAELD